MPLRQLRPVPRLAMPPRSRLVSIPLEEPTLSRTIGIIRRRGRPLRAGPDLFRQLLLAFKEPAPDNSASGCFGSDARLDVYLVTNVGFRGLTTPEGFDSRHAPTFIMIQDEADDHLPALIAHRQQARIDLIGRRQRRVDCQRRRTANLGH